MDSRGAVKGGVGTCLVALLAALSTVQASAYTDPGLWSSLWTGSPGGRPQAVSAPPVAQFTPSAPGTPTGPPPATSTQPAAIVEPGPPVAPPSPPRQLVSPFTADAAQMEERPLVVPAPGVTPTTGGSAAWRRISSTDPSWFGTQSVYGGAVGGTPESVSRYEGATDVFWTGIDSSVWHAFYSGSWSPPEEISPPQTISGNPRPVISADGSMGVFWRGPDLNLWYTYFASGSWQPVKKLSTFVLGDPQAVSASAGTVDVFWRGQDLRLWTTHCSSGCGPAREISPVQMMGEPSLTVASANEMFASWRAQDATLWAMRYDGSWEAPVYLGQAAASDPTVVSPGGESADIYWQGTGGQLWLEAFRPAAGWLGPTPTTTGVAGRPAAARTMVNDEMVVYQGTNGGLWDVEVKGGAPTVSRLDDGPVVGDASVGGWFGHPEVFWQGFGSSLRFNARDSLMRTNYLPTPLIRQSLPLDCEAASLRAALATAGVSVSEGWELGQFGADLRPAITSGGNVIEWGDAWQTFVGNVNASEGNFTGYGLYWPPLQKVVSQVGHVAVGGQGWTPRDIYLELSAGHAVVIWINNSYRWTPVRYWTAWDGASVPYTIPGDHAVVLSGVDLSNYTIQLVDVAEGIHRTFSMAQFENFWSTYANMALVVS